MATTKYKRATKKPIDNKDLRLVYRDPSGPGEDATVWVADVLHPYTAAEIAGGTLRLFDPATDDRGAEVPIIATYTGSKDSTWFPLTSGTYCLELDASYTGNIRLGFGTRSQPMNTRSQLHRLYLDTVGRSPELIPFLKLLKVPAIFSRDHATCPGGSRVELRVEDLPAPATGELPKTYM